MNVRSLRAVLGALAFGSLVGGVSAETEPVFVIKEGRTPPAQFSKERPDYMHFKEIKVTRNQKQELTFEITLHGKIPTRTDERIEFYIGFDIDNDVGTGSVATTNREFGRDLGIWFVREPKSSQFRDFTGDVEYKGVKRELKIGLARFQGDKITFKVRSDLFSLFPSLKMFLSAEHTFYEKGKQAQEIEVIQSGNFVLGS